MVKREQLVGFEVEEAKAVPRARVEVEVVCDEPDGREGMRGERAASDGLHASLRARLATPPPGRPFPGPGASATA